MGIFSVPRIYGYEKQRGDRQNLSLLAITFDDH